MAFVVSKIRKIVFGTNAPAGGGGSPVQTSTTLQTSTTQVTQG